MRQDIGFELGETRSSGTFARSCAEGEVKPKMSRNFSSTVIAASAALARSSAPSAGLSQGRWSAALVTAGVTSNKAANAEAFIIFGMVDLVIKRNGLWRAVMGDVPDIQGILSSQAPGEKSIAGRRSADGPDQGSAR